MSEGRDYLLKPTGRPIHAIAIEVCEKHGVTLAELQSPLRFKPIVRARWELMARAYSETGASFPVIGRFLNRDHTTVMHGVLKHRAAMNETGISYRAAAYPHAVVLPGPTA